MKRDVGSDRADDREEGIEGFAGTVCDPERGATALEAFDGGTAGGTAGTEEHNGCAGEVEAEGFPDGGGEAVAVGVEAVPAALGPAKGVDGTNRAGGGVDFGDAVEGDDLVGDGEIHAAKFLRVEQVECARQIVRVDFEADVLPGGEAGVGPGEFGERGIVHARAEGVLDRMAEHGERCAGPRPSGQVGEGEDGGVCDVQG